MQRYFPLKRRKSKDRKNLQTKVQVRNCKGQAYSVLCAHSFFPFEKRYACFDYFPSNHFVRLNLRVCVCITCYSSSQMKCQGGNKYALSITVKFDQSTRRFGRISFARLFKFTKHIASLFYLLSPYLLSCMRGSRNVRTNMHIIKTIIKFCPHWSTFVVWRNPTP